MTITATAACAAALNIVGKVYPSTDDGWGHQVWDADKSAYWMAGSQPYRWAVLDRRSDLILHALLAGGVDRDTAQSIAFRHAEDGRRCDTPWRQVVSKALRDRPA
jgi:hypothetical protein